MKIYLASSWRNAHQPAVLQALLDAGHEVYDFRNPPNRSGFGWEQLALGDLRGEPENYLKALEHPIAKAGFRSDMDALQGCDACVLVLPCGRSAHLELGWATGAGKKTFVLLDRKVDEPELMYLMCDGVLRSVPELLRALAAEEKPAPAPVRCAEYGCANPARHGFEGGGPFLCWQHAGNLPEVDDDGRVVTISTHAGPFPEAPAEKPDDACPKCGSTETTFGYGLAGGGGIGSYRVCLSEECGHLWGKVQDADDPGPTAAPAEPKPCARCGGCKQIANTDDGEPWTAWAELPPGADVAVRTGLVKPIPCPGCQGASRG